MNIYRELVAESERERCFAAVQWATMARNLAAIGATRQAAAHARLARRELEA